VHTGPIHPAVWLYTNDLQTIRVIQRTLEHGWEVLMFAPEGVHTRQLFSTAEDAAHFRATLELEILAKGFELAWRNDPQQT
jgi:hypothetical protein